MTDAPDIFVQTDGPVLLIGINRPDKRNSLTPQMMVDLGSALTRLNDDPALRVGVLYGEGDHFTSGLDLMQFVPLFVGTGCAAGNARRRRAATQKSLRQAADRRCSGHHFYRRH